MRYRSVQDLNESIIRWSRTLPQNLSLIVGVPRSGLLAASLLALHLHRPLMDLNSFLAGLTPKEGFREAAVRGTSPGRVLVVDDSVNNGREMQRVRHLLGDVRTSRNVLLGAVYASPQGKRHVDVFAEVLPQPRAFEWNILHHDVISRSCMDIDGVLLADPDREVNDDGKRYRAYILGAPLRYKPRGSVGTLVTSRLEKYRPETEDWLLRNEVLYEELLMLDLPTAKARSAERAHVPHKARAYLRSGRELFIESSDWEARGIHELTRKPVFVTDSRSYLGNKDGVGQGFRQSRIADILRNVRNRL